MLVPTNSQIDKAGDRVRKYREQPGDFELIRYYRNFRTQLLLPVFRDVVRAIENVPCVVACRVKRFDTILRKLRRPVLSTKLVKMDDVVGYRVVCCHLQDQARCVSQLQATLKGVRAKNYLDRENGYRAVHLIGQVQQALMGSPTERDYSYEVQVRTYYQHIWATVSESFGEKVKAGGGDAETQAYLLCLCSRIKCFESNRSSEPQRELESDHSVSFFLCNYDKRLGEIVRKDYFGSDFSGAMNMYEYLERQELDERYETVLLGVSDELTLRVTHERYFGVKGVPPIPESITPRRARPTHKPPGRTPV